MASSSENSVILIGRDKKLIETLKVLINGLEGYNVSNTVYETKTEKIQASIGYNPPEIILFHFEPRNGDHEMEIINDLTERYKRTDVIAVSKEIDEKVIFDTLHAGASGYVVDTGNLIELANAVKEIGQGGAPLSPEVSKIVVESFHRKSESPLSQRELQVLSLLVKGKPYSSIAEELDISKETAKSHIKNIYRKLKVKNKSEAISLALHENWITGFE